MKLILTYIRVTIICVSFGFKQQKTLSVTKTNITVLFLPEEETNASNSQKQYYCLSLT